MTPLVARAPTYSINALNRWSSNGKTLPAVPDIKNLHVYDFDNTLFSSPLPNPQLWYGPTIGYLQTYECFTQGGWWHDASILAATGDGIDIEEPRGWKGWWNEEVVKLVQLSMQQKDTLTILLTGRAENNFAELVNKMVNSRQLEFDLVVLKPEVGPLGQRFPSTMEFKQVFLRDLVNTYKTADEIRIYEDRPRHVKGFREYFEKLNKSLLSHKVDEPPPVRKPITAEIIPVADLNSYLDPIVECASIQRVINRHNIAVTNKEPNPTNSQYGRMQIKKNFVYFGYLIKASDSARLLTLANIQPPTLIDNGEVRLMASSILISARPATTTLQNKVGGTGKSLMWAVNGTAVFENRIWAARVAPVDEREKYHVPGQMPFVVLAIRKGARAIDAERIQNWQPVPPEKQLIFNSVVGDKVMLKIEPEESDEEEGAYQPRNGQGSGGYKRRYGEQNGYRNNDIPRSDSRTGDRDAGSFQRRGNRGGGGGGDRHGQGRFFNSMQGQGQGQGRNFSGGQGGIRGGGGGGLNRRQDFQHQNRGGNRIQGGSAGNRGRGGGGGGGRGPGYKSLDDYGNGSGGFDGSNEYGGQKGGGGSGGGGGELNY